MTVNMTVDVTVNMTVDMTVQMMMIPRSGLTPPPRFLSMKNDTGAQVDNNVRTILNSYP